MTEARRAKLDAAAAEMRLKAARRRDDPDLALWLDAVRELRDAQRAVASMQRTVWLHELRVSCLRARAFPGAAVLEPVPPPALPPAA
jgi:hypothetical protein